MKKFLTVATLLAIGVALGRWIFATPEIEDAVADGSVEVTVEAHNETAAAFTITRRSGLTKVVIPAGTIIYNRASNGQRLITAQTVTVRLAGDRATARLETYCLDQFADRPTAASSMGVALPGSFVDGTGYDPVEMERTQELVACMAGRSDTRRARELAVWIVKGQLANQTYEGLRVKLRQDYVKRLTRDGEPEFRREAEAMLRRDRPDLDSGSIARIIETFVWDHFPTRVEAEATQQADEDLRDIVALTKPILEGCARDQAQGALFSTTR